MLRLKNCIGFPDPISQQGDDCSGKNSRKTHDPPCAHTAPVGRVIGYQRGNSRPRGPNRADKRPETEFPRGQKVFLFRVPVSCFHVAVQFQNYQNHTIDDKADQDLSVYVINLSFKLQDFLLLLFKNSFQQLQKNNYN